MKLFYCITLIILGQAIVWFQNQSQFIWPWTVKYRLLTAVVGGSITTYMFIISSQYGYEYFDHNTWPQRIIGSAVGTLVFTSMTWAFLNEGVDTKTGISIALSFIIIFLQIFWK